MAFLWITKNVISPKRVSSEKPLALFSGISSLWQIGYVIIMALYYSLKESFARAVLIDRIGGSQVESPASESLGVTPLGAPFLLCPEEIFESHGVAGIRRWQPFLWQIHWC